MNRMHIHVTVDDLAQAKSYYAALFGQAPSVEKPDYLKWSMDDPSVNFAVTYRKAGRDTGVDHIGIQTDSDAALETLHNRMAEAQLATTPECDVQCCYAQSNKHWATDPAGIVWEMFHTMASAQTYGSYEPEQPAELKEACC